MAASRGVPLSRGFLHGALETNGAALLPGAGAEVDDVVGDRDGLGLCSGRHGVALVAQLEEQIVHLLDVMGVQADRGFVEDVGDVGERRPEEWRIILVRCASPRTGSRRPVE